MKPQRRVGDEQFNKEQTMKTLTKNDIEKSPFIQADSYKLAHWLEYPEGTSLVYTNFTPRTSRRTEQGISKFVWFGLQAFLDDLSERFAGFFSMSEDDAVDSFVDFYREFFCVDECPISGNVASLHRLGYLPLEFWALPEGTAVPHGVPCMTVHNTDPKFHWLTNFIETWLSASVWHMSTSATTAAYYRKTFDDLAAITSDQSYMPEFQGHDFSMRGLPTIQAGAASGAGHLVSFKGTDTLPAITFVKRHYGCSGLIGTSVPATEHSVMMAGNKEDERETYLRLLTKVHPKGVVSMVSDTWDFWKVVTETLPSLKAEIMARDGKLVVRPDSSPKTPVEIICGDPEAVHGTPEQKGLAQCLWETFGGTVNSKGYRELDSHIGMIYGDSITLGFQRAILEGLRQKGFASTNVVLGIGSYTYQYVTRDTHGIAMKCTYVEVDGVPRPIFKDPKTDNSGKKSARGALSVRGNEYEGYTVHEHGSLVSCREDSMNVMRLVWKDGKDIVRQSFDEVRETLRKHLPCL